MGRPKGSANKKKANGTVPAADRNVTNHHNNLVREPLTNEQLEALTNQHVVKIDKLEAAKKLADANFKNAYKVAKADGISKAHIDAYRNARTEEGQAKLREQAAIIAQVASWFKFATQADLFGESDEPAPVGNKSYRLGKEAGMNGEKPVVPDGLDHETFMQGYHAGQAQMASIGIKQSPEETNTGDEFDA